MEVKVEVKWMEETMYNNHRWPSLLRDHAFIVVPFPLCFRQSGLASSFPSLVVAGWKLGLVCLNLV